MPDNQHPVEALAKKKLEEAGSRATGPSAALDLLLWMLEDLGVPIPEDRDRLEQHVLDLAGLPMEDVHEGLGIAGELEVDLRETQSPKELAEEILESAHWVLAGQDGTYPSVPGQWTNL